MKQTPNYGTRTLEQVKEHYEVEKELARQLLQASKDARSYLYTQLYDQLFERIPHHPQLLNKHDSTERDREVSYRVKLLQPFLKPYGVFLEVGPGDCKLSYALTTMVRQVYAVDVSEHITHDLARPANFKLIISDGCSIPVKPESVNVAFSDQLMEHLHPDDAFEQLLNLYGVLAPGGIYLFLTPNRLCGPHDVSRYFDEKATGFHLKEYTNRELEKLLKQVGFAKIRVRLSYHNLVLPLPLSILPFTWYEYLLSKLPRPWGKKFAKLLLLVALEAIK